MKCKNHLCVYEKKGTCILCEAEEIELDSTGRCKACRYPYIPEEIWEREKEKSRKEYERLRKDLLKRVGAEDAKACQTPPSERALFLQDTRGDADNTVDKME